MFLSPECPKRAELRHPVPVTQSSETVETLFYPWFCHKCWSFHSDKPPKTEWQVNWDNLCMRWVMGEHSHILCRPNFPERARERKEAVITLSGPHELVTLSGQKNPDWSHSQAQRNWSQDANKLSLSSLNLWSEPRHIFLSRSIQWKTLLVFSNSFMRGALMSPIPRESAFFAVQSF